MNSEIPTTKPTFQDLLNTFNDPDKTICQQLAMQNWKLSDDKTFVVCVECGQKVFLSIPAEGGACCGNKLTLKRMLDYTIINQNHLTDCKRHQPFSEIRCLSDGGCQIIYNLSIETNRKNSFSCFRADHLFDDISSKYGCFYDPKVREIFHLKCGFSYSLEQTYPVDTITDSDRREYIKYHIEPEINKFISCHNNARSQCDSLPPTLEPYHFLSMPIFGQGKAENTDHEKKPPCSTDSLRYEDKPVLHPEFADEEVRRKSIDENIVSKKCFPIMPKTSLLAKAGMFHDKNGENSALECFNCGWVRFFWNENDDPVVKHAVEHPDCNHIQQVLSDEVIYPSKKPSLEGEVDEFGLNEQFSDLTLQSSPVSTNQSVKSPIQDFWGKEQFATNYTGKSKRKEYIDGLTDMGFESFETTLDKIIKDQDSKNQEVTMDLIVQLLLDRDRKTEKLQSSRLLPEPKPLKNANKQHENPTQAIENPTARKSDYRAAQQHVRGSNPTDIKLKEDTSLDEYLAKKIQEMKDDFECIVCMTEFKSKLFLPCGHIICCDTCAYKFTECPSCRQKIEKILPFNHI